MPTQAEDRMHEMLQFVDAPRDRNAVILRAYEQPPDFPPDIEDPKAAAAVFVYDTQGRQP